jgi:hypothetical protein
VPASLVSLAEMKSHLGLGENDTEHDVRVQDLIDRTVALFELEADRTGRPFQASASRTEVCDGTGGNALFLDYPIKTLTSVKIGRDAAAPDETLLVSDVNVLSFSVSARELRRTDGGIFGDFDVPRCVQVVYVTQDDLPLDAKLVIIRLVAQYFHQRGSEDAQQESALGYTRTMADLAAQDTDWSRAVDKHLLRWAGR